MCVEENPKKKAASLVSLHAFGKSRWRCLASLVLQHPLCCLVIGQAAVTWLNFV